MGVQNEISTVSPASTRLTGISEEEKSKNDQGWLCLAPQTVHFATQSEAESVEITP
jgi:hypothetical protein